MVQPIKTLCFVVLGKKSGTVDYWLTSKYCNGHAFMSFSVEIGRISIDLVDLPVDSDVQSCTSAPCIAGLPMPISHCRF